MKSRLLGGMTAREFLRRHWQKRPLFVRAALPQFDGLLDARALGALSLRDDVESRRVTRRGRRWETTQGPFRKVFFAKKDFTLLVSGLNLHLDAADRLLRRFDFVPQARLDDVMVSFAAPGGGVGPHVDSYDVFLLQGEGVRRWTVWSPGGTKRAFLSRSGDLLYLPPGWKHDGVALEPCFTYSIGFRAPRGREFAAAFLDFLHERGLPDGRYRDPHLAPARRAAAIPAGMISFAGQVLKKIRWSNAEVLHFLGEYLTMPKSHLVFAPSHTKGPWIRLDAKTQLLYRGTQFFINGDAFRLPARDCPAMRELADQRGIAENRLARQAALIREWRRAGYVHLEKRDG